MDKTAQEILMELKRAGFSTKALARRFDASSQTIWNLRAGKTQYAVKGLEEKIKRFHVQLSNAGAL